jgi:iron(III) transport system substrate-binding protein
MTSGILLVALVASVACASAAPAGGPGVPAGGAQAAPAGRSTGPAPGASAVPAWQQQWDQLVAAAQQEGRLAIAGPAFAQLRQQLPVDFRQRFGITVEYTGGRGAETASRLLAEQQAGLYNYDVAIVGTNLEHLYEHQALDPVRPILIHPDAADDAKWKLGGLYFLDPDGRYIMRVSSFAPPQRVINTALVRPEEASWQGLLDPKWRGRIATTDPMGTGSGEGNASYILHALGDDYFARLYVGQQVVFTRDDRQLGDWVAHGTYPVSIGLNASEYSRLKSDGLPVAYLPNPPEAPGYLSSGSGYVGLLKNAPHPNAAKLFLNWLVSKEGQEAYNRAYGWPSARADLDDSWAVPETIPQPGLTYLDTDSVDYRQRVEPPLLRRMREILARR